MPTATQNWIAEVKAFGVLEVARLAGLKVAGLKVAGLEAGRRKSLTPCPSCQAERRGHNDPIGPVGLTRNEQGWHCHRCQAKGDALALASWHVLGRGEARDREEWAEVRAWCSEQGLCEPLASRKDSSKPTPPKRTPAPPRPQEPPRRPPAAEVLEVWDQALAVEDDPEVHDWLKDVRGFDPLHLAFIVDRDLARALPKDKPLPSWCRFRGRPWPETGHRLIVRMFGAAGALESLHARSVLPGASAGEKAAAAAGVSCAGLVLADPLGQLLLETGAAPPWWQGPIRFVVAEGEPDFLTWATSYGDAAQDAPAVLGVVSGSWTQEIADRIPSDSVISLRTHQDEAGNQYALKIKDTLAGRCKLLRPKETTEETAAKAED